MQKQLNIYQAAREKTPFTQEQAAECIGISTDSIKAYEQGRRRPSDELVSLMVDIYENPYLGYQHLLSSPLKALLPEVEPYGLEQAAMRLLRLMSKFAKDERLHQLLEIAEDGVIDSKELPLFQEIMQELDEIVEAALAIDFSGQKKSSNNILLDDIKKSEKFFK